VDEQKTYTAFANTEMVATGPLGAVLAEVKQRSDRDPGAFLPIFDDLTGRQVDFDLRGTLPEVLARALPVPQRTGPGRPKLGVTAREISLLPRHWEWLEQQPNGASAAIRRLVDEARKTDPDEQRIRLAIEAASRYLSAMAGNLPGYEEATRALYNRNRLRFDEHTVTWPADIRLYANRLTTGAF
jgi:hypothetical protein